MQYLFGSFRLDPARFELLQDGDPVSIEPQALQLLLHLVQNRDRMVSKDEVVEVIWNGRAISDASISSRISLARGAIGDDGGRQAFIRTVHGRGFRFVAPVEEVQGCAAEAVTVSVTASVAPSVTAAAAEPAAPAQKPSIAVLPLRPLNVSPERAVMADAISHDVIQAISRLRWLTVIARGSSFWFRDAIPDVAEIAAALNVRYVLTGMIEAEAGRLAATLELTDGPSGAVVWADRLTVAAEAVQELRAQIVIHLVAALEVYIPLNEAMAAKLGSTDQLDAWASYHLGLHHMYRFSQRDNAHATALFERAVSLDPQFARAHAGLSFTRFQDCFMRYEGTPEAMASAARHHAERGLELDPLDPFINFNMGRSFWLTDEPNTAAIAMYVEGFRRGQKFLETAAEVTTKKPVILLKGGRPVDGFMGALPESQVRQFLAQHGVEPGAPVEEVVAEDIPLDPADRIAELEAQIAADPDKAELQLDLAVELARIGDTERASQLLDALPAKLATDDRAKKVRATLGFASALRDAPAMAELEHRVAHDGTDLDARHLLGVQYLVGGDAEGAFEQFLEMLRQDKQWRDGLPRKLLIDAFNVVEDADLVGRARRRMSSMLF